MTSIPEAQILDHKDRPDRLQSVRRKIEEWKILQGVALLRYSSQACRVCSRPRVWSSHDVGSDHQLVFHSEYAGYRVRLDVGDLPITFIQDDSGKFDTSVFDDNPNGTLRIERVLLKAGVAADSARQPHSELVIEVGDGSDVNLISDVFRAGSRFDNLDRGAAIRVVSHLAAWRAPAG